MLNYERRGNEAGEASEMADSMDVTFSVFYLPIDEDGDVSLGYDSANRLRQYQRGTLASTGGIDDAGGGSISTSITLPGTEQSKTYVLDGLGNWKSTAYTQVNGGGSTTAYNQSRNHNYVNQITSTTTVDGGTATISFSYDHGNNTGGVKGNGNLANDGVRTYQYDAFNRLIVVGDAETSDTIATYTYDALGRRIRKVIADLGSGMGGLTGDIPAG
jgi:YD repeat-containing protein